MVYAHCTAQGLHDAEVQRAVEAEESLAAMRLSRSKFEAAWTDHRRKREAALVLQRHFRARRSKAVAAHTTEREQVRGRASNQAQSKIVHRSVIDFWGSILSTRWSLGPGYVCNLSRLERILYMKV